jgi:hypothetical protein
MPAWMLRGFSSGLIGELATRLALGVPQPEGIMAGPVAPPRISDRPTLYFMRYIAGLATTVTSKSLIKEKASMRKKPMKRINKTIMLILKKNVGSSRLLAEVTG